MLSAGGSFLEQVLQAEVLANARTSVPLKIQSVRRRCWMLFVPILLVTQRFDGTHHGSFASWIDPKDQSCSDGNQ